MIKRCKKEAIILKYAKPESVKKAAYKEPKTAVENKPATVEDLVALTIADGDSSIEEVRQAMVAKIGENILISRFSRYKVGEVA